MKSYEPSNKWGWTPAKKDWRTKDQTTDRDRNGDHRKDGCKK